MTGDTSLHENEEIACEGGLLRMRAVPGLWIHGDAVFAGDYTATTAALAEGAASDEHRTILEVLSRRKS